MPTKLTKKSQCMQADFFVLVMKSVPHMVEDIQKYAW